MLQCNDLQLKWQIIIFRVLPLKRTIIPKEQYLFLPFGLIKPAIEFIGTLISTAKYKHFPGKSLYFSELLDQGNNLG
jgi:hypothetical protein